MREPQTASDGRSDRTLYAGLALVVLTLLVFLPIVRHGFVEFDDDRLIRDNAAFNPVTFEKIIRYWAGPYYGGAFPVTHTVLGALAAVSRGPDGVIQPGPFHAFSVALHVGAVVIAFFTMRRLVKQDLAAALGAAVFAVHPMQVESVAWATNINTLLYGFFSLLAIYLYVIYAQRDREGSRNRQKLLYGAATLSFALAMWSKPVAVPLPLVVAAIDAWWIGRPLRRVAVSAGIWLAMTVPVAILTRMMLEQPEVFVPPPWARPLVALDAIAFYLWKLVLPTGTIPDYGRSPRWLMDSAALYTTWIVPIVLAIVLFNGRRRGAPLLAAGVAFVAPLLPVLGLTPFHQQQYSTVADRYVYVSLLGAGAALAWVASRTSRPIVTYLLIVWVVVLALWSRIEVTKWRDTETLFGVTTRRNPASVPAHNVLGLMAAARGEYDVAMAEYRKALETDPGYAPAHFASGNVHLRHARYEEAIASYQTALARAPGNAKAHNNLGVALVSLGRVEESVPQFEAAVRADPGWAEARANLDRAVAMRQRATTKPASGPATAPAR